MQAHGTAQAAGLKVTSVELFNRDVALRLPFRFGVITLTEAPQAFVRVRIRLDDGTEAAGTTTQTERVGDGLPETLEEAIGDFGLRYFRLKLRGGLAADIKRLRAIAAVLDRCIGDDQITLDGNEQYTDVAAVLLLPDAIEIYPALARLRASTLVIEQPVHRTSALTHDVAEISSRLPVIIDESDAELSGFLQARNTGYDGVSTKVCKGVYKTLLNAACRKAWNEDETRQRYFIPAEDLTCQAWLGVQQDPALVSSLGTSHVERNGHHYVNGMAGASSDERAEFFHMHSDLYGVRNGRVSLAVKDGSIEIGSLGCACFAAAAEPGWSAMWETDQGQTSNQ
ncbi:MAG: hypothetical protein KTR19_11270 [Hyphomicrobiales bacterium]|nr:hypothetical protein [Hyphomicrobiales bacterium]